MAKDNEKKAAPLRGVKVVGSERVQVAIKLTDSEHIEASRSLQRKLAEQRSLEEQKAAVSSTLGGKIKDAKKVVVELGDIVASGLRYEMLECEVRKNYDNSRVETVRPDTGEVVSWRNMTLGDRQMSFAEKMTTEDKADDAAAKSEKKTSAKGAKTAGKPKLVKTEKTGNGTAKKPIKPVRNPLPEPSGVVDATTH